MLSKKQQVIKRLFDIFFAVIGLTILAIPMAVLILIASISTKKGGVFAQERIGQYAKPFTMYKIRSMLNVSSKNHITTTKDVRITKFGRFIRKYNLDELPQLYNVLLGNMSFVGPRPDVKGYADKLKGKDKIIVSVKPGITGPATLHFKNEEEILANKENAKKYNDEVLWKEKVQLNKKYIENWSLSGDIKYIIKTLF